MAGLVEMNISGCGTYRGVGACAVSWELMEAFGVRLPSPLSNDL